MPFHLTYSRYLGAITLLAVSGVCGAQKPATAITAVPWVAANKAGAAPSTTAPSSRLLPELFNADTAPNVLAKFTPPASEAQVVNSDYLLLEAPPIALAGPITVHLLSELPGADLFLLFNAKPHAKEASLLSANFIPPLTKAEVRVPVKLTTTTDLLFIARANGRWYKVSSEVKIAQKDKK